jgi:hypothetical protein
MGANHAIAQVIAELDLSEDRYLACGHALAEQGNNLLRASWLWQHQSTAKTRRVLIT